jgi:branched-chain amino acid transport system substrate-binding protein
MLQGEVRGRRAGISRWPKRHALFTVTALLVLVASACSSSKKSSSTATTAGSATTAAGSATTASAANGSPIVVGGVGSIQNAGAAGMDMGFKARITRFNNTGGVNGHKINFLGVQDDGGVPAKALSIVQGLVEQNHVAAVAPILSLGFNGSQFQFLGQNKVPGVGWAVTADWCQDPWALGNTGCLDGTNLKTVGTENLVQYSQYKNVPIPQIRLAVFGNSVPGSAATVTTHATAYKAMGANVVYAQSPIPTGVTDFTPYADQILASKPTLVISYTSVADSLGIFGAMKSAGYKGDIMNGTGEIPGLFQNAAIESVLNGGYSYSADFPVPEEGTPVIKQEQSDLAAIGQPTTLNLGITVGWFSADFYIQALEATAKAGLPLTGAGVDQAVNAGFTYNSPAGGPQGVAYPAAENVVLDCESLVKIDGATKTYIVAGKYTCKAPASVP